MKWSIKYALSEFQLVVSKAFGEHILFPASIPADLFESLQVIKELLFFTVGRKMMHLLSANGISHWEESKPSCKV